MSDVVGKPEDMYSRDADQITKLLIDVRQCVTKGILRIRVNHQKTNGLSHPFQLGESTFILGASGVIFHYISFFDVIHVSKQDIPSWDGVTSGTILFAYVPSLGRQAYID